MHLRNLSINKAGVQKAVAALVLATGLGLVASPPVHAQNAVTLLQSNPEMSEWLHIVQLAGLVPAGSTNVVTVFALTNDGFDKLNAMWRGQLRPQGANKSVNYQLLQRIVRTQAVLGIHPPSEFSGKMTHLTSVAGTPITVDGTAANGLTTTMAYATGHVTGAPMTSSEAVIYPIEVSNVHQ